MEPRGSLAKSSRGVTVPYISRHQNSGKRTKNARQHKAVRGLEGSNQGSRPHGEPCPSRCPELRRAGASEEEIQRMTGEVDEDAGDKG